MLTDFELRKGLRLLLEEVEEEYGHRALPRLFKSMVPKSWSQAQILNCLVEYGLQEDRYTITSGNLCGKYVDFFPLYKEDWMKVVSCPEKPRHDLEALEQRGFIRKLGTRRLAKGPRKCTTVQINWLLVLVEVRDRRSGLKDYKSWSAPDYVEESVEELEEEPMQYDLDLGIGCELRDRF